MLSDEFCANIAVIPYMAMMVIDCVVAEWVLNVTLLMISWDPQHYVTKMIYAVYLLRVA